MSAFAESVTLEQLDADPYPVYQRLRAEEPVAWMPALKAWLVTRWDDVRTVISNADSFVTNSPSAPQVKVAGSGNMLSTEGDTHAQWREAVDERFCPEALPEISAYARDAARTCVQALTDLPGTDLVEHYFDVVGASTVLKVLQLDGTVGVGQIVGWSTGISGGLGNPNGDPERLRRAAEAGADMEATLLPLVQALTDNPDGSLISRLIHAGRPPGQPRPPKDIMSQFKAMTSSVRQPGWISGNALYALLTHPEQLAAVRAEPALLADAVHESLRWAPTVGVIDRWTTGPMSFGGHDLPADAQLAVGIASANRDGLSFRGPALGSDPNEFDIRRPRQPHVTLGYARHSCLLIPFVPQVVQAALSALLDAFPRLRLDDAAPAPHGWKFRKLESLPVRWD
jgi:cytochrome P450